MEAKNEIVTLSAALQLVVPSAIPLDLQRYFDWTAVSHLQAYFFGGSVELGGVAQDPKQRFAHALQVLSFAVNHGVHVSALRNTDDFRTVGKFGGELTTNDSGIETCITNAAKEVTSYRFLFVDIETTGLNVHSDEIVDIAFYDPVTDTHYSSLVNPMREVKTSSTLIHQLTLNELQAHPPIDDLLPAIARFLKPSSPSEVTVLVGHNAFSLDEPLLRRTLAKSPEVDLSRILFCDTLPLFKAHKARKSKPRLPSKSLKLNDLASHFQITPNGPMHRALTDAMVLWQVVDRTCGLSNKATGARMGTHRGSAGCTRISEGTSSIRFRRDCVRSCVSVPARRVYRQAAGQQAGEA